jgi:hypothetical protein
MDRHYDYRPKWTTIILCGGFFGACAFILGREAQKNNRGLIINGIIDLSPRGATIFYWVLAALSVGFVVVAGFLIIVRLTLHRRIGLTRTSISIPRSRWSNEERVVPFAEILRLSQSEAYGQRFLNIEFIGGKFALTSSLLPSKADFKEICAAVNEGVQASQAHAP